MLPPLRWPRLTPGVKRLVVLGVPGVLSGASTQINIFVGTLIASFAPGAVTLLSLADRLYQLPLGLIGIPIGVVLLPHLTRQLAAKDEVGGMASQNRAVEYSMLLTLPATAALMAIPLFLMRVIYERGLFTEADSQAAAIALTAFAAGLPSFVLNKAFSPGFFAREDTKTPMIFTAISVVINIVVSIVLFQVIGFWAVAVGTSVAGWVGAILLGWTLWRRGHFVPDGRLKSRLPRILLASILMGVLVYLLGVVLDPVLDQGIWSKLGGLGLLVGAGMASFALLAVLFGAIRFSDMRELRSRA